ncbi:O-acetylhomoserine aminocarboxypropyltransferase/cysteine synthase family protein [Deinococcus peraridilitoris]|uniref:O-acetylhomoserine sulfhydrylase n=1 Tax=Deinococcus peraridilitoris (strain DSM 19664 / LMG 22246 / CIP 109416 / KR-200) TaxID=937777 RepID=K9ZXT3_DEIPD|nr:PLP-dependent transferase [Deinococcus peraridilitoris]AFZ66473.1 O-acetylhomoserine sulfhydrylase [Deinococcus peraridilitoris DSM 19664]
MSHPKEQSKNFVNSLDEAHSATQAVHVGLQRGPGEGVGLPIYDAVAWEFQDLEHAAHIFATNDGLSYSRIGNPTLSALEARVSALEGALGAVVTGTGQAATLLSLITLARAGDHIVASASLFGGTVALLTSVLPNFGITTSLVANDAESIRAALQPNTRAVLVETIGNPALDIPDFGAISGVTRTAGVPLIVDNTWGAVGALCQPFRHGADIIVHSLTKWAAGHGAALGGAVLCRPGLDCSANPLFSEHDREGVSLWQRHGELAFLWRARQLGLSQMGMVLSPQLAKSIFQGLETMQLRVERECATTLALAHWLQSQPGVTQVAYPGLESHPSNTLAHRYLPSGPGAVLTFNVAGGLEGASRFLSALTLIRRAANLGDTRTLAIHPWTTTHGRLGEAARIQAGVTPDLIRLSVGLEAPGDLQADLRRALDAALRSELVSSD